MSCGLVQVGLQVAERSSIPLAAAESRDVFDWGAQWWEWNQVPVDFAAEVHRQSLADAGLRSEPVGRTRRWFGSRIRRIDQK